MRRNPSCLRLLLGLVLAPVLAGSGLGLATAPAAQAAGCPGPGGVSLPRASATGDVVFRGGGWGHGLGMSQYGAQGAARLGCDAATILTTYYAGTSVTTAPMPTAVSLRMLDNGYRADVEAQTGDLGWELDGCTTGCPPVQPKGSNWQLRLGDSADGDPSGVASHYVLWDLGTTPKSLAWEGGTPEQKLRLRHSGNVVHLTTWKSSSIYLDRRLRWDWTRFGIDTSATGTGRLDAVQVITDDATGSAVDKYLRGIAEVPVSWSNGAQEALKAQAIAARTYAVKRADRVLMPTPADQNYTGYAKELEDAQFRDGAGRNLRWQAAVDATSGKVVTATSTGTMADTFYSSSVGGHSEDERFVWGEESPFLRGVDDSRWEMASSNPAGNRSWAKGFSWSTLAGKLGFQSISAISVPRRGSAARVAGVKVTGVRPGGSGVAATTYLEGWDVRQALGLLSPGFEIASMHIGGKHARPIVGDWNGDGTDDLGWFRRGDIALRMTGATGTWVKRYRYGKKGDRPVVGDWDGDGSDDVGLFRSGTWLLPTGGPGATPVSFRYGVKGDRPVVGRWKGTTSGIGVVRDGRWRLRRSATPGPAHIRFRFGTPHDRPVVGDWDGNGTTTVGVRHGRRWLLRDRLAGGPATRSFRFDGGSGGRVGKGRHDRGVFGDWDGNGTVTAGYVHGRTFSLRNRAGGGKVTTVVGFAG